MTQGEMGTPTESSTVNSKETGTMEERVMNSQEAAQPQAKKAHPGQQVLGEGNKEAKKKFLERKAATAGGLTPAQQRAAQEISTPTANGSQEHLAARERSARARPLAAASATEATRELSQSSSQAAQHHAQHEAVPPKEAPPCPLRRARAEKGGETVSSHAQQASRAARAPEKTHGEDQTGEQREQDCPLLGTHVAVLFAGDSESEGSYIKQMRDRCAKVSTWEKRDDEAGQDLGDEKVQSDFTQRMEAGEFDFIFLGPPCASFSTDHDICLRPTDSPWLGLSLIHI